MRDRLKQISGFHRFTDQSVPYLNIKRLEMARLQIRKNRVKSCIDTFLFEPETPHFFIVFHFSSVFPIVSCKQRHPWVGSLNVASRPSR
jgi:hypothetical protein